MLDVAALLSLLSSFSNFMRLLMKLLWLVAFLAATFVWMVLFQHGFSMEAFRRGAGQEWRELEQWIRGGSDDGDSPALPAKKADAKAKAEAGAEADSVAGSVAPKKP